MAKLVRKYSITCLDTGKTAITDEDVSYLLEGPDDNKKRMEFFMVFIGMRELLLDKDLNGTDWRVLLMLCDLMKEGGWSDITQEALAGCIHTYKANVNKSISKMIGRGYLTRERHPQSRRLTLRIRADIAGCGGHAVTQARRSVARKQKQEMGEMK